MLIVAKSSPLWLGIEEPSWGALGRPTGGISPPLEKTALFDSGTLKMVRL
jgi:hypothetical protein